MVVVVVVVVGERDMRNDKQQDSVRVELARDCRFSLNRWVDVSELKCLSYFLRRNPRKMVSSQHIQHIKMILDTRSIMQSLTRRDSFRHGYAVIRL